MGDTRTVRSLPSETGEAQLFGTVTVLVTDIVASTELLRRVGDGKYAEMLDRHTAETSRTVEAMGGHQVAFGGDGFIWAFGSARRAARAALDVRAAIARLFSCGSVRLRAGLHTGELLFSECSGPVGLALHEAAIIGNAAPADSVWVSELTHSLLEPNGSFAFGPREVVDIPKLGPTPVRSLEGLRDHEHAPALVSVI